MFDHFAFTSEHGDVADVERAVRVVTTGIFIMYSGYVAEQLSGCFLIGAMGALKVDLFMISRCRTGNGN